MKTRARKPIGSKTSAESTQDECHSANRQTLPASVQRPPQLVVLPDGISANARLISARVPGARGNSEARRYLVCPQKGLYEFTKIAAPRKTCCSWLITTDESDQAPPEVDREDNASTDQAYVLQLPELLVATPLDPLFFLLASPGVLWPRTAMGKPEYLSKDTRLGLLRTQNEHLDCVLRSNPQCQFEISLERRIEAVCDVIEIPGEGLERSYCLSPTKLCVELMQIASRVANNGLPPSLEEQFVRQALVVPELSIRREDSGMSVVDIGDSIAAQPRSETVDPTTSSDEKETSAHAQTPSDEVLQLLRIRTVIRYMLTSYLTKDLSTKLEEVMAANQNAIDQIDFTLLDSHLKQIEDLKQKAQVLRSLSENITRKRTAIDDDEAEERLEAKKRRKEQEDINKKNMTRGVQQLAKADTSGMKKLSAFFTKVTTKK